MTIVVDNQDVLIERHSVGRVGLSLLPEIYVERGVNFRHIGAISFSA